MESNDEINLEIDLFRNDINVLCAMSKLL